MSSPEIKVLSFNTQEALADPKRSDEVLRLLEVLNPGVGVLHSAYWTRPNAQSPLREEKSPILARFVSRLIDLGYEVSSHDEGDTTDRPDKTGFVGFVRPELGRGEIMDATTRQGYLATVTDPELGTELRIGGLHVTDMSEAERLVQIKSLPVLDAFLSDVNAIHRRDRVARILRPLGPLTDLIPPTGERDHNTLRGIGRVWAVATLLQRLVGMADGRSIEALEAQGLIDADPNHQATIQKLGIGVAQLDHIMYRSKTVSASNFRVHKDVRIADHWPISASLSARQTET